MPDGAPKATICAIVLIAVLGSCDNSSYELNHAMEICDRHHPLLPSTCPQVQADKFGPESNPCDDWPMIDPNKYMPGWEMCSVVDRRWHKQLRETEQNVQAAEDRQTAEERGFVERYVGMRR